MFPAHVPTNAQQTMEFQVADLSQDNPQIPLPRKFSGLLPSIISSKIIESVPFDSKILSYSSFLSVFAW